MLFAQIGIIGARYAPTNKAPRDMRIGLLNTAPKTTPNIPINPITLEVGIVNALEVFLVSIEFTGYLLFSKLGLCHGAIKANLNQLSIPVSYLIVAANLYTR